MKQYKSPLPLLGDSWNPEALSRTAIRQKRKELVLRFELTGATQLDYSGVKYDKNTLLNAFEDLEERLDFHLTIYKNEKLRSFLEEGDLTFFKTEEAWRDFENAGFVREVQPYFTDQFSEVVYEALSKKDFRNIHKLTNIFESQFPLPMIYKEKGFIKPFLFFKERIEDLNVLKKRPDLIKKEKSKWRLHPDFWELVPFNFYNKLATLPTEFDGLIIKLLEELEDILSVVVDTDTEIINFDRDTIYEMKYLCEFHFEKTGEGQMLANLRNIERGLLAPEVGKFDIYFDKIGRYLVLIILPIVYLVYKIIMFFFV